MTIQPKEHLKKQAVDGLKTTKQSFEYRSLEKASKIANYYGFSRLPQINVLKTDVAQARPLNILSDESVFKNIHAEEQIAILNAQSRKELNHLGQPIMTFYESRLVHEGQSKVLEHTLTLDVIGSASPLAEAALIHIAQIILTEEGLGDVSVELNSVGDRESMAKFNRELSSYYKKISSDLNAPLKVLLKKDPISLLCSDDARAKEINADAPQSVSCLSESSGNNFKAVLEYLEELDITYQINPLLIPDRTIASETVFCIHGSDTDTMKPPYALGVRYNGLSKKIGLKRDMPACRVTIVLPKTKMELVKTVPKKVKKCSFYFVQIGTEAKLKSLQVLEILRKAKIPLRYGLIKDKLTGQLNAAEQMHTPYVLLMGQRECMENTVLVRNMENYSQESVDIADLVEYLKKLEC